ncbi:MAG: flagellar hook-basal body complex protein FliE [Chloroflexi bacterium]|nr:flagellar hook-basal body complex protein FliE [Chloroflexota bacterium]
MAIQPIHNNSIPALRGLDPSQKSTAGGNVGDIGQTFEDILSSLNQSQLSADDLVRKLAQGENVDLHTVMIGLEENNVNFNVALGIRDRLVEAYREIMRMQV